MKRILSALLVSVLAVGIFAGCGSSPAPAGNDTGTTAPAQDQQPTDGEKALVYVFIRNRGDLSYWDNIAAGGDRAAQDFAARADIKVIETTADLTANLTAMYEAADAGVDLIITAGDYKDNMIELAQEYPDIAFSMISEDIGDQADNIHCFDFVVSEATFLAGIVAADRAAQDGKDTIGFIGGVDEVVIIQEFFVGYIQGAKYANPDINVVYNYVGDWSDPDTARTQALAQYNDAGAAVIFACAGGSGNGVHTAAAEAEKYVIGVDTDQSLMYASDKNIQDRFVTSVLKMCDNAVYDVIEEFLDNGTLPFGEMQVQGIAQNVVGIVENDLFVTLVSEEGKVKLKTAQEEIASGKVTVWNTIGKEQSVIQGKIAEIIG